VQQNCHLRQWVAIDGKWFDVVTGAGQEFFAFMDEQEAIAEMLAQRTSQAVVADKRLHLLFKRLTIGAAEGSQIFCVLLTGLTDQEFIRKVATSRRHAEAQPGWRLALAQALALTIQRLAR
jgi:hypothetical protein